jgi:transcription initiation factor TFIIB
MATSEIWASFNTIKSSFNEDEVEKLDSKENKNINKIDYCKFCKEESIQEEYGVLLCIKCGIVNSNIIDRDQEWRYYGLEDNKKGDPNRCGMPINPLLPQSSLGTIILGKGIENYRQIHRWNSMSSDERSLLNVCRKIDLITQLPQIVLDDAKIIYKQINDEKLKKGSSRQALIAACIFYSCNKRGIIKSEKEIAEIFDIPLKKMNNGCKQYEEIIYEKDGNYKKNIKYISSDEFIENYCKKLNIDEKYIKVANKINGIIKKTGLLSEHTPPSIAVGIICLLSEHFKLNVSKKTISKKCDISEVTITKAYKKLNKWKKIFMLKKN